VALRDVFWMLLAIRLVSCRLLRVADSARQLSCCEGRVPNEQCDSCQHTRHQDGPHHYLGAIVYSSVSADKAQRGSPTGRTLERRLTKQPQTVVVPCIRVSRTPLLPLSTTNVAVLRAVT
jgi:hypothetical protein